MQVEVVVGDITEQHVDAIVNAANASLLGGGGVDGAIHRAAGPQLLAFCRGLQGCATGQAKLSPAFALPCRYVLHTVGPVWQGGEHDEPALLAACYIACLELATQHNLHSVAFPAISTGVYGYPPELACSIAVDTVTAWSGPYPSRVVFVCFDPATAAHYRAWVS